MLHSLLLFFGLLLLIVLGSIDLTLNLLIFISFFSLSYFFNLSVFLIINKIKYFIFSLLLIYFLSTPGEILFYYSFISATKEGLYLGINNSLRIINTFLTVMFLMEFIPKKFFINFIIKICYPLKFFGLNIDNLTSRIFLTFDYLEFYKDYSFKLSDFPKVLNKHLNSNFPNIKIKKLPRVALIITDYFWIAAFFITFIGIQFFNL
tara:strand:+ start:87 stop:704 length:618 start_codon:yes stop_codon:yes gene_type:complete